MSIQGKRTLPAWMISLVIIVLIVGFFLLRPLQIKPLVWVEGTTVRIFSGVFHQVSDWTLQTRRFLTGISKAGTLMKENEELSMEIRLQRVRMALLQHLGHENQRLKELMKLDQLSDYPVNYAHIIFRDGINPQNFTISLGEIDQIEVNQAVVVPIELGQQKILYHMMVGRIYEVLPHTSRVLSVKDERSQISIRNMKNQALGTLGYETNSNHLYMQVRQDNYDFEVGDLLVTSELSTLPRGLIVGYVSQIEESETLYKRIRVMVPLPLLSFTEVGVLTP